MKVEEHDVILCVMIHAPLSLLHCCMCTCVLHRASYVWNMAYVVVPHAAVFEHGYTVQWCK